MFLNPKLVVYLRTVAGAASNLRLIVGVSNRVSVAGKEFLRGGLASRHGTPYVVIIAMGPLKSSARHGVMSYLHSSHAAHAKSPGTASPCTNI